MKLPTGKTCGDCAYKNRCVSMLGKREEDITCDFFPRRFVEDKP
jgi:hypothetical protein